MAQWCRWSLRAQHPKRIFEKFHGTRLPPHLRISYHPKASMTLIQWSTLHSDVLVLFFSPSFRAEPNVISLWAALSRPSFLSHWYRRQLTHHCSVATKLWIHQIDNDYQLIMNPWDVGCKMNFRNCPKSSNIQSMWSHIFDFHWEPPISCVRWIGKSLGDDHRISANLPHLRSKGNTSGMIQDIKCWISTFVVHLIQDLMDMNAKTHEIQTQLRRAHKGGSDCKS